MKFTLGLFGQLSDWQVTDRRQGDRIDLRPPRLAVSVPRWSGRRR